MLMASTNLSGVILMYLQAILKPLAGRVAPCPHLSSLPSPLAVLEAF